MNCPICGAEIVETTEFCPKCLNRMPGQPSHQPGLPWGAVLVGVLLGFSVGLLMVVFALDWPGPPFLPAALLLYGLGLAVLLLGTLGKGLFPESIRPQLTPFSVAFTIAYYVSSVGYLSALVG